MNNYGIGVEENNEIIAELVDVEKKEAINEDENYFEKLDINITELWLLQNITDISPITKFKNLEFLCINFYENVEDWNPIFDLPNLKQLMIYGNNSYLIDLVHIGKLQKLEFLFILGGITQDGINNLANLRQLKELDVFLIDIVDISPLSKLPNLEIIQLYSAHKYYDITPLAASKSLKEINLSFGSEEEYIKFMNNEGKIFSENGIYIPRNDWR
jgi:hypothetical protein